MKKLFIRFVLLTLSLAMVLSQAALAEPSDNLRAVYDALTAEDSSFSQASALFAQYYEGVSMTAALEDTGITFTIESADEYVSSGTWTFTEEGDFLTSDLQAGDLFGAGFGQYIMLSAASAHGVNQTLLNGYNSALTMTGQENKYVAYEQNETDGTVRISVNIAGPFDLEGLDDMVLTEDVLKAQSYGPLGDDFASRVISFGKITLLVNGSTNNAVFLVMEYGEPGDLTFRAVTAAVSVLQPAGWEDFIAAFTELKDVEGENFSAVVNADETAVKEIVDELPEGYSFTVVRIGQAAAVAE